MNPNEVILVCGFGRCGSSLLMQMIGAAGVPLYHAKPPVYEAPEASWLPDNTEWLPEAAGTAVKVLSPQIYTPPVGLVPLRAIWLDRDADQQARSLCKLRKYDPTRATRRRFKAKLARDRPKALRALNVACSEPPLLLHFESILASPLGAAAVLAAWLGQGEPRKMEAQVITRSTAARPGFEIERLNTGAARIR